MKHMGASGDATAQAAPSITLSKTPTSLGLLMPSRGGERGISLRDTVSSGVAHPALARGGANSNRWVDGFDREIGRKRLFPNPMSGRS